VSIHDGRAADEVDALMLSIMLRKAEHTRRYLISTLSDAGWEVKLEQEGELTHHVYYHDWHRVERALAMCRLEVSELTARGWQEIS
jgi:hypothetical protein